MQNNYVTGVTYLKLAKAPDIILQAPLIDNESFAASCDEIEPDGFEIEAVAELETELVRDELEALEQARRAADAEMPKDLVGTYLKQIGGVALLSAEEEVELAKGIETGLYADKLIEMQEIISSQLLDELRWLVTDGQRAKKHLIEANLRWVVNLAKRYTDRGLPFNDLIQEGNLGLIRAVEKFDYTKGYKFSTYATWCIRQKILIALQDQVRLIYVPDDGIGILNMLRRVKSDFLNDNEREPTSVELAAMTGLDIDKVEEWEIIAAQEPGSLNKLIDDEGALERGETIADLSTNLERDVLQLVATEGLYDAIAAIRRFKPIVAEVLCLRYGLGGDVLTSEADTAKLLRIRRSGVRHYMKIGEQMLAHPTFSSYLDGVLES